MKKLLAALICVAVLPSCSTITRGTKQKYAIRTEPPGAKVRLSTGIECVTPCDLQLKRKMSFSADIVMDGYEPEVVKVTSKIAGEGMATGTAGNFLLGGIIGSAVDSFNGSMRTLYPEKIELTLRSSSGAPSVASAESKVAVPVVDQEGVVTVAPAAAPAPAAVPAAQAPAAQPVSSPDAPAQPASTPSR